MKIPFRGTRVARRLVVAGVAALAALTGTTQFMSAAPALADPVVYEISGHWKDQPDSVRSGIDVLGAVWKFDVNDDGPAPSNDPVANNVLTVTARHGKFTKLPSTCVADEKDDAGNKVDPVSSISDNGKTLICNLGTRAQGTADLALTGIVPEGKAGDKVSASAEYRGKTAKLPEIPILAAFGMDAKFDSGTPLSQVGVPTDVQFISFPFSVSHANGSADGPDTLVYDLTITDNTHNDVELRDGGACVAIDRTQSGYPYSDGKHKGDESTAFPDCSVTKVDDTHFRLTLRDLEYGTKAPSRDSNGGTLPSGQDVIAAGDLLFQVPWATDRNGSTVTISASLSDATPYVASDGATSDEDPSNNKNSTPIIRGSWTGGWAMNSQKPQSFGGQAWSDTFRAPAGSTVMSVGAVNVPRDDQVTDNWVCKVLDTDHVTFVDARGILKKGSSLYYDDSYTGDLWYYTGKVSDPNTFECGGVTKKGEPAAGNGEGWSTSVPSDPSTVRAVKMQVTSAMGPQVTLPNGQAYIAVDQRIKADAPLGQDVWSWTSKLDEGDDDWAWDGGFGPDAKLLDQDRSTDVSDAKPWETKTPDARFPYAGPGRDVMRVVGSLPVVDKHVDQKEYGPGQTADYRINYGLETVMAQPAPDEVVVKDSLPAGMQYVEGSSSPEPEVSGDPADGQDLIWTFDHVMPNDDSGVINYKAIVPKDAEPGAEYVNKVKASSQGNTRSADAKFIIPDSGYTSLTKGVAESTVALVDGSGSDRWNLRLESQSPDVASSTDVIDILPYQGDGRGTNHSGSITLDGEVQGPEGSKIYYTTEDPAKLDEDPGSSVNGGFSAPSAIWSTDYTSDATAFRVVGPELAFRDVQKIDVPVVVSGAKDSDVFVNTAVARSANTEMRMRASASFTVTSDETPTEPTDPSEPTEPTDPSEPTDPTEPTDPSDPSDPSEPSEPSHPTAPARPTEPTGPDGPSAPASHAPTSPAPDTPVGATASTGGTTQDTSGIWIIVGAAGGLVLVIALAALVSHRRKMR
jgi:hypothetical protein